MGKGWWWEVINEGSSDQPQTQIVLILLAASNL